MFNHHAVAHGLSLIHILTLLVADIDHFKRVNDVYGHVTGDRVIQYVAKTLEYSIRKTDIAARIGGEEFSIMLNGIGRADAVLLADRIRMSISDHMNFLLYTSGF